MNPWCARMKQLIEEHQVDEPPKPDFSRSLPPLLMETLDTCDVLESHGEKFTVRLGFQLLFSTVACGVYCCVLHRHALRLTGAPRSALTTPATTSQTRLKKLRLRPNRAAAFKTARIFLCRTPRRPHASARPRHSSYSSPHSRWLTAPLAQHDLPASEYSHCFERAINNRSSAALMWPVTQLLT
jgi:hypothetical protein